MTERSATSWAAWLVAGLLAVLAVSRLLDGSAGSVPVPVRVEGAETGSVTSAGRGGNRARRIGGVYVHVVGAVRRPGLYELGPADRVARAVQRAGGPAARADLSALNLAARLEDGQQVVVPRAGAPGAAAAAAQATAAAARPSLAQATQEQLEELDGIGPTLAKRIVEHRQAHGGFGSIADLAEVDGIGPARLASLREALSP